MQTTKMSVSCRFPIGFTLDSKENILKKSFENDLMSKQSRKTFDKRPTREIMSSRSIGTSNVQGMFRNRYCKCGKKAAVGISESNENPGKLYYKCANKQCNFFAWWSSPSMNEVRKVDEEVESTNSENIEVKEDVRAILRRLRDLEANQLTLKFIVIATVFGSWIIVMLLFMILLK